VRRALPQQLDADARSAVHADASGVAKNVPPVLAIAISCLAGDPVCTSGAQCIPGLANIEGRCMHAADTDYTEDNCQNNVVTWKTLTGTISRLYFAVKVRRLALGMTSVSCRSTRCNIYQLEVEDLIAKAQP